MTGGLGFIGSQFVRLVHDERPEIDLVVLDAETYAGNHANLACLAGSPRYAFLAGDVADRAAVRRAIGAGVDAIVNFAAETHVDRSIDDGEAFVRTDVLGTYVLLEAARRHGVARFVQVSTDEVYGDLRDGHAAETDPLAPRSPYAASKAGGDLQVLAHRATFGTPVLVTRGSNTFGPHQFPEKLVPLFLTNLLDDEPVPVYGDGLQIRDWLHVEDHARGILHVLDHGVAGEIYNLGGGNERTNLEITRRLVALCGRAFATHVRHVVDRPGHDRRYALDTSKARALGWRPRLAFEDALDATAAWYRAHESWWRPLKESASARESRRRYAEGRAS